MTDMTVLETRPVLESTLGVITRTIQAALRQKGCSGEFQLSQIVDTGAPVQIMAREVDIKLPPDELMQRAVDVAMEFHDRALEHVRVHQLPQKYAVNGFKKGSGEPMEYNVIRLFPPSSNELSGLTVSPTDRGTMQLLQEVLLAHAAHGYRATDNEVIRLVQMLGMAEARANRAESRVEKLENSRADVAAKYEEILSKQWERDKEKRALDKTEEQADKMMSAAMTVGKLWLMNHGFDLAKLSLAAGVDLTGAAGAAAPPDKGATEIETAGKNVARSILTFFNGLSQEQLGKIKDILSDEQMANLQGIATSSMGLMNMKVPEKPPVVTQVKEVS